MEKILKKHAEKIRFGLVGIFNTGLDFTILIFVASLGTPVVLSNFISTSVAIFFSFFANKKYTFKDISSDNKRQLALFVVITLFGLWIIQPIIIVAAQSLISGINDYLSLIIAKILATIASLIWNYLLYKKFVFINKSEKVG